jgi:hypothetical protein
MPKYDIRLFADFYGRKLISAEGGVADSISLVADDVQKVSLRTYDRTDTGIVEIFPKIRSARISVGKVMDPPDSGTFKLKIEDPEGLIEDGVTVDIAAGADAATFQTAFQNATAGFGDPWTLSDISLPAPSCWVFRIQGNIQEMTTIDAPMSITNAVFTGATESFTIYGKFFKNESTPALTFELYKDEARTEFLHATSLDSAPDGINVSENPVTGFGTVTGILFDVAGFDDMPDVLNVDFEINYSGPEDAEPVDFSVHTNHLAPSSFVRVRSYVQGDDTWYEVRLIRSPLAFADLFNRVLPDPPSVELLRDGAPREVGVTANTNEVQILKVPSDFQGTYYLKWDYRTTTVLGIEDGPDEIAAALNAMFDDGKIRFIVTNPEPESAYIEFTGLLGEADQPMIEVQVNTFNAGPIVFDLNLRTAPMAYALRTVPDLKVPLEVELEVVDDDEDPEDPEVPGRTLTLFQQDITVRREQIWEELATVPDIQWANPPQPKDFIPFTPDQIITGSQHYLVTIGDGVAEIFVLNHNLGTSAGHIAVRENFDGGRLLNDGSDYLVEFTTEDQITLYVAGPYGSDALAFLLSTAGPISAFQAHTHTVGQIVGLQDLIDAFDARLADIEDRMPFTNPGAPTNPGGTRSLTIANYFETFPGKFEKDTEFGAEPTVPLRVGGLFPAVHDASVTNVTALPSPTAGSVWMNNAAPLILIPGGYGFKSRYVKQNEFMASDGRRVYHASREGVTNSYYPTDMERELFIIAMNDRLLRPGDALQITFDLSLQVLKTLTRCQYLLQIEWGTVPQDASPSPIGINLSDVVWDNDPMLQQRIIVTSLKQTHSFGVAVRRSVADVMAADKLIYAVWEGVGATAVPTSANFVLRARLLEFDTENSVSAPKGYVHVAMDNVSGSVETA